MFIQLDKNSKIPMYKQLYCFLLDEIKSGRIQNNEKLPSRRELSSKLKISENTVNAAYQELIDEGYLVSKKNSGFYANALNEIIKDSDYSSWYEDYGYIHNPTYNNIDVSYIKRDVWEDIVRSAVFAEDEYFDHGKKQGEYPLRKALSKHLYKSYGLIASPDNILIGCGIHYLLTEFFKIMGRDAVYGIENPINTKLYNTFSSCNVNFTLIDTGLNGLDFEMLYNSDVNILHIMPEHQIPAGSRLTLEQRKKLLKWAYEKDNRYIIEYPSDGCYILDEEFIPSLYSLDTKGRVIYVDSFERSFASGIKTAFFILPEKIMELFKDKLIYYNPLTSRFEQQFLTNFIDDKCFAKHIKTMQKVYKKKNDLVIKLFQNSSIAEHIQFYNSNRGTFLIVLIKSDIRGFSFRHTALESGVKLISLQNFLYRQSNFVPERAFVFGYGGLSLADIEDAVMRLEQAWSKLL